MRVNYRWPQAKFSATHIVMNSLVKLKLFLIGVSILLVVGLLGIRASAAMSELKVVTSDLQNSVIPKGLACDTTLTLPSGRTQRGPAFLTDHMLLGPVAAALLEEGGEGNTKKPSESVYFIGTIFEDKIAD